MKNTLIDFIKRTPLRPVARWLYLRFLELRWIYRRRYFKHKLGEIIDHPDIPLDDENVLHDLSYGWANWVSASTDYLIDSVNHISLAKLPILECGSGLSTIVCGLVAKRYGNTVWSLESSKKWYKRTKYYLDKYQIDSVRLFYCPLTDHGDFDWYDAPLGSIPPSFSVVVCDGPVDEERGRRYGLFSVMNQRLSPGCVILFDNADSENEKKGLLYWLNNLGVNEMDIDKKNSESPQPYIVITLPKNNPDKDR